MNSAGCKSTKYGVARKLGDVFRFIGVIIINEGNEFEHHYNEIDQPELIFKTESLIFIEMRIKLKHRFVR